MSHDINELRRRRLSTPFVHVPSVDWAKVRCGEKREFRTHPNGGNMHWTHWNMSTVPMPFPVVAYTILRPGVRAAGGTRLEELLLLEAVWSEPLRAIGPESLEREGFASRAEFKRYWIRRHPRGGWRALSTVIVVQMRPMGEGDLEEAKDRLFEHFFEPWLEPVPYQPLRMLG